MLNPDIRNTDFKKDVSGCLGKLVLVKNRLNELYVAKDFTRFTEANIILLNCNNQDIVDTLDPDYLNNAKCRIYITVNKTPKLLDIYEPEIVLEPNAVFNRYGVILGKNERVLVWTNQSNIIAKIEGYENNPLG